MSEPVAVTITAPTPVVGTLATPPPLGIGPVGTSATQGELTKETERAQAAEALKLAKASNLSDVASTGISRQNIHVPELAASHAVATANITLSGTQTVDGFALAEGNLCLATAQTEAKSNGPWEVKVGAWVRPTDFQTGNEVKARKCAVINGTVNANSEWLLSTNTTVTIDTTAQTWKLLQPSSVASRSAENTFTAAQTMTANFAAQSYATFGSTSQDPRVPFKSSQGINSAQAGLSDHVAHELQTIVTGQFAESTGSDPNWAWGLNVFTTTGNASGDANGLVRLENLIETAVRAPVGSSIEEVIGLVGQADFFGSTAGAVVGTMIGIRAAAPSRNGGATAGTATTAYSLLVEKATTAAVGATTAYSLRVLGGYSELDGNVQIVGETASAVPLTIKMAPEQSAVVLKIVNALEAQVFRITKEGGVGASNSVLAFEGQARQTLIGFAGPTGQSGIAMGETSDTILYRIAASTMASTTPLFFKQTAAPSTQAGYGGLYDLVIAGKDRLSFLPATGSSQTIGDAQWAKTWTLFTPQAAGSIRTAGSGSSSTTGTITLVQALISMPQLANFASAASGNAIADAATSGGSGVQVYRGSAGNLYAGFDYHATLGFPDASYNAAGASTGARIFVGLSSALGTTFGADRGGASHVAAFCRSNVEGGTTDTTWQFVTNNATTSTVVNTEMAFTIGHLYAFHIWCPAGSATVYWQIEDVTEATSKSGTATETLPTSTQALFGFAGVSTVNAVVRNFQLARLWLATDKG